MKRNWNQLFVKWAQYVYFLKWESVINYKRSYLGPYKGLLRELGLWKVTKVVHPSVQNFRKWKLALTCLLFLPLQQMRLVWPASLPQLSSINQTVLLFSRLFRHHLADASRPQKCFHSPKLNSEDFPLIFTTMALYSLYRWERLRM